MEQKIFIIIQGKEEHRLGITNVDFNKIDELSDRQIQEMLKLMTPRLNSYIPHTPTVKQSVFMNLTNKEAFFGGAAGGGKDIACTTPIFTPDGWKTMQDIHPGDYVYGRDGKPIRVLAESEIFHHDCYEVHFDNREVIVAGATHLWTVVTANRSQRNKLTKRPHAAIGNCLKTLETKFLAGDLYCDNSSGTSKYRVPIAHAITGEAAVPIDPYLLGYWLGDGTTKDGVITTEDTEVVEHIAKTRPIHKAYHNSKIQFRIDGLLPELRVLGVYGNKHIPDVYLKASYEDRLELLRGLMDSDGTVDNRGVMCFCNTNRRLTQDVQTLLGTLGIKSGIAHVQSNHDTYDVEYRNTFSTLERVFNLPRKYNRQKIDLKGVENWFYIRDIRPTESVPTKCIKVDAEDGLFRVGYSMVLTHNSDALLMDALQDVHKKGYAAIIFRRSYADLRKPGALIPRAKEWLMPHVISKDIRWNEKDNRFEFLDKYGSHSEVRSILQFGYLETDNDKYNYQGGEYQYIGFDEVTHISESNYTYMFSRLRRLNNCAITLKVRSASNPPEDDQGQWVFKRFVDPRTRKESAIFIPAKMDDNPYLDKEAYEESLEELDPVTRARLRDGNWEVQRKGEMFKENWFEYVDAPPANRRRIRFWDMAATDPNRVKRKKADPDYTVGMLLSEAQGIYYIEDIIRVRLRPFETQQLQASTAVSDGYATRIREEQEPGSSGVSIIDVKARSIFKGYDYKGIKSTGSKILRANAVSAAAERGHVKIVRGCRNIKEFIAEAESFPAGVHDDTVDGLSGAYNALRESNRGSIPIGVGDNDSYWDTSNVIEFAPAGSWY